RSRTRGAIARRQRAALGPPRPRDRRTLWAPRARNRIGDLTRALARSTAAMLPVAGHCPHCRRGSRDESLRRFVYDRADRRTRTGEDAMRMLKTLASVALALAIVSPAVARTEVKIGLIAPMSGPWARQGDLMLKGANLAIEDINKQGGIKALAGAKLKLIVFDAGDSVEKAKNAAQRMIAQEPDLVGATGA